VSMTGCWDAHKLDIPKQFPMLMVMAMMSSKRKPPSMLPSQDDICTLIRDFTELTMANADIDRHLVQVTSGRLDGWMLDIMEVEIWRMVSLWLFLLSVHFTSILLWIPALYKWHWRGFLPPPEISQAEVEFLHARGLLNGYHTGLNSCGTYGFICLHTLNGCLIVSFPLYFCMRVCSTGGRHPKRGIMYWHGCT